MILNGREFSFAFKNRKEKERENVHASRLKIVDAIYFMILFL